MAKCFGEFLCGKCGRVLKKSFEIQSNDDIANLYVDCQCGHHVEQYIPVSMRDALLELASKGYKVLMINEKTVGVILNHKLDINKLPKLPYEFSYDTTEPEGDIIMNARIAAGDFEDIDEETYIKEAIENFTDWCKELPLIEDGEYIDMDKEE